MNIVDFFEKVKCKFVHKEIKKTITDKIMYYYTLPNMTRIYKKTQEHYDDVLKILKVKLKQGNKIQVGFYVIYDSVFSAKPLFEKMLKDALFDPYIVIASDVARGYENMVYQQNKSYQGLVDLYGKVRVIPGHDNIANKFIDCSDKFDIIYLANPYDEMTYKYFQITYLINKNILTFHTNYSFVVAADYFRNNVIKNSFMNLVWKIFVETEDCHREFRRYQKIKGKNICLSGYCKLDEYAVQKKTNKDRKRIIIAPHHTISEKVPKAIRLSNFFEYSNFFLELPLRYPELDFVFRPHPLLFVNLAKEDVWGEKKTNEYLRRLLSNKNVSYSSSGSYYDVFKNSDGMIHDCCGFAAEYLVTGYPCCYILKNKFQVEAIFNRIGKACLDFHYKAFNENDILQFIDEIIIKNNDMNKESRRIFVENNLKINFPNVTDKILLEIKHAINEA